MEKFEKEGITDENFLDLIDKTDAQKVKFTMEDGKSFTIEVYPKVAPRTADNFLMLVDEGFYEGLTFHRVIPGFMAQGGAYDPINQMNDPVDSIKGEF
ncbi:MAG: peptidylprolyl isomerase, partial [Clostridia bacterium]|nr:peptidylprolyl isomerase [Clostridia bacterium]